MSLKDELLKQESAPADEQADILERIKKDQRRVSRLKRLAIGSWVFFIVGWFAWIVVGGLIEMFFDPAHHNLAILLWGIVGAFVAVSALAIAIVSTVSLYVRWRSMTMGKIMATLAALQEDVQRLSQACADLQVGAVRESES